MLRLQMQAYLSGGDGHEDLDWLIRHDARQCEWYEMSHVYR